MIGQGEFEAQTEDDLSATYLKKNDNLIHFAPFLSIIDHKNTLLHIMCKL